MDNESERGVEACQLLDLLISYDDEAAPNGLMDCVDNDGCPYQSAAMAGLIVHARMLVRPFDAAKALTEYRASQTPPTTPTGERG